jgi:hypothetical protein
MRPRLVYADIYRLGATGMSDQYELINLQAMTGKLFIDGELAAEYKVEQCDKCAMVTQLDQFGYQKSDPKENIIWFCKGCR